MSHRNQQRSVEESRSFLGGTHAMKSVKPSVDILEGLSTVFITGVSEPHLIHKLLTSHSRPRSCCLTFMLFLFFCAVEIYGET
jgi:hypothetical protein